MGGVGRSTIAVGTGNPPQTHCTKVFLWLEELSMGEDASCSEQQKTQSLEERAGGFGRFPM